MNMKFHATVGILLTFIAIDLRSVYSSLTPISPRQNDLVKRSDLDDSELSVPELEVLDNGGNLRDTNLQKKANNDDNHVGNGSKLEITDDVNKSVLFYLYTQSNPKDQQELHVNDKEHLANSNFNVSRPTRIVTHGWRSSYLSKSCTTVRDAYLAVGDYNVILVDWSLFSKRNYLYASTHVKRVGKRVAAMIDFLEKEGMNLTETIAVGHSLGAHVIGLASYYALSTVGYIVGLDPAYPGFLTALAGSRISKADANYVQIIHTDAGHLGFPFAIGHADFYPNGGVNQPGCPSTRGDRCSHDRSYEYFAESITTSVGFYGSHWSDYMKCVLGWCNNKNRMSVMGGSKLNSTITGIYFLNTNKSYPYALGPKVVS